MSTRCNIKFIQGNDSILFYKHCDGYPEITYEGKKYGIVLMLQEFFDWYELDPRHDINKIATAFTYWYKKAQFEDNKDIKYLKTESSKISGDFEICIDHDLHGDIEYYYEVDFNEQVIRVFKTGILTHNNRPELFDTQEIKYPAIEKSA